MACGRAFVRASECACARARMLCMACVACVACVACTRVCAVCTCACVHAHACVHTCMCTCVRARMCVQVRACTCVRVRAHVCVCVHTRGAHACVCACIRAHVCRHTRAGTRVQAHACMHVHTRVHRRACTRVHVQVPCDSPMMSHTVGPEAPTGRAEMRLAEWQVPRSTILAASNASTVLYLGRCGPTRARISTESRADVVRAHEQMCSRAVGRCGVGSRADVRPGHASR